MKSAVQDLQTDIKSLPSLIIPQPLPETGNPQDKKTEANSTEVPSVMEMIPLLTLTSLLIEIASRIKRIVSAVEELADIAQFQPVTDEKTTELKPDYKIAKDQNKEDETLQRV